MNDVSQFAFYAPVKVVFGRGKNEALVTQLTDRGWSRIMVVTDVNVATTCGKALLSRLRSGMSRVLVWDQTRSEPTDASVQPGVQAALDFQPDVIIALGGGSAIDTAKLIAVAAEAGDVNVSQFLMPQTRAVERHLPLVTLPTTAGSGAEITRGVVITDESAGVKRGFASSGCYAEFAIIDPELSETMPNDVRRSSGIDAFCHALEAYLSPTPFPTGDALALYSLSIVREHFVDACCGSRPAARDAMMACSFMACLAFSTGAGLTFAHLFSDVLGPRFNVRHGFASAMVLPGMIGGLQKRMGRRTEQAAAVLDGDRSLLDSVRALLSAAHVPHISEVLTREQADFLVDETFRLSFRSRSFSREEAKEAVSTSFDIDW